MKTILSAILDDDPARVTELLEADRGLVTRQVEDAKLYEAKILHWLYVGDTALHLAAAGYREKIVKILLAAGADPNAAGNHRRSGPLHYAADGYSIGPAWDPQRQVETIRILLKAGADLHAADKNGATPLHRAVRTRCAAAVRYLLEAGADPTRKNLPGSTAFHLAVQNTGRGGSGAESAIAAQRQIIEEFLSRGVSPAIQDGKGKSVADSATSAWIRSLLSEYAV
ncbi:MAG: ankyrin repeat domain-containing protein [Terriglobia bacterium]